MSEVKLPEPFGWKMFNPEYDYGITVYERYQVEDYLTQGWKIEETTFRTVQMEEYAEQRVREAMSGSRNLKSHEEYWVDNRQQIIDCLEKAGYTLVSNQHGFFLHPKIGMGIAQDKA